MRSTVRFSVIAILPIVFSLAACQAKTDTPANLDAGGPAQTVVTAPATSVDWPAQFEAGGVLRARTTATVASRLMAPIVAIHVRPGDHVRRGQLLVELEAASLMAQATRASAAATAAGLASHAAAADVEGAEAALALANTTHRRMVALLAERAATQQELDETVAALAAAEARLKSAKARQSEAAAGADAAIAAHAAATNDATYRQLTAPLDGIITERAADPGSMAVPGVALLVVESPSTLQLELNIDASRAAFVAVGQSVGVRIDADAANVAPRTGRVSEISRIDAGGHSFGVKVDLTNTSSLRSGLYGRARFDGPPRKTVVIPVSAVIRRGQLSFVFVASDGRARLRAVSLGETGAQGIEVLDGLIAGESVLRSPSATLTDGARISVTGASR